MTDEIYPPRRARVHRETKETSVRVVLDLDGTGEARVSTGVPFLDHMLDALARHGGLDPEVEARGDLERALRHANEARSILAETLGATHHDAARRHARIGDLHARRGDVEAAHAEHVRTLDACI